MTTVEPDEQGKTARIEQVPLSPGPSALPYSSQPSDPEAVPVATQTASTAATDVEQPANFVARPASHSQQEVMFVPLAVNVGDGFKFGCGFFLALVLTMLIGFVLVAGLFVLTSVFGLNLPITR